MLGKWISRRPWRIPNNPLVGKSPPRKFLSQSSATRQRNQIIPRGIHTARDRLLAPVNGRRGARTLFTESIPSILVPPAIFIGLLLALWTWKCFWIVVLQDRLLYLSWLPPLSRSENISDYEGEFRGVQWTEKRIRSLDGTKLALCEGRFPSKPSEGSVVQRKKSVVICYFQGNGGSTPLRLPLLSQVMCAIKEASGSSDTNHVEYVVVALSYRGYWKSSGRATQSGIETDAQAFLEWVRETYATPDTDLQVVLWGHSLGAAVASAATVTHLARTPSKGPSKEETSPGTVALPIAGLILEAPISSIKDMLISLYPQKWLPYRYLWPFSWNTWDVAATLERLAQYKKGIPSSTALSVGNASTVPPILLMSAENDEVIPLWVADHLEERARNLHHDVKRKNVKAALHVEGPLKVDGRNALVDFILRVSGSK
ncbi:alpha/beta hydrolase family protein [Aspergillus lucknowensis]|uniref:Alpha/Beta hydrolase protein n=1 Tax=Aspergillus lucknowensis TaxID=176173 RepID=A0ABR4LKQ4_9EURO